MKVFLVSLAAGIAMNVFAGTHIVEGEEIVSENTFYVSKVRPESDENGSLSFSDSCPEGFYLYGGKCYKIYESNESDENDTVELEEHGSLTLEDLKEIASVICIDFGGSWVDDEKGSRCVGIKRDFVTDDMIESAFRDMEKEREAKRKM